MGILILAAGGLGLACLPKIAFGLLIIALFLLIVWLIVGKLAPAYASYVNWVILIIVLIIVLYALVEIYSNGLQWAC